MTITIPAREVRPGDRLVHRLGSGAVRTSPVVAVDHGINVFGNVVIYHGGHATSVRPPDCPTEVERTS